MKRSMILGILVALCILAMASVVSATSTEFQQCENNFKGPLGTCEWTNGILNAQHSLYYEHMGVPQRLLLYDIPTGQSSYTLYFNHEATKASAPSHAYDWLINYSQAEVLAAEVDADFTPGLYLQACNDLKTNPTNVKGICEALRDGTSGGSCTDVEVPNDPYVSGLYNAITTNGSYQAKINAFESQYGTRTIRVCGNAPFSVAPHFTPLTHEQADDSSADDYIQYQLTWSSASTQILVLWAGHLAWSEDVAPGWGEPFGASNINGGPYHMRLTTLNSESLGSQDNQIMGSSILRRPEATVTKTAVASFNRTCDWGLNKTVDVDEWDMFTGDTGISEFTLEPSVECTDSGDFAVTGTIVILNSGTISASVTSITDLISPGAIPGIVTGCTVPFDLAPAATKICSYSAALPDDTTRVNNVTVIMGGNTFEGSAGIVFGEPTEVIHDCVILDDTNDGFGSPIQLCNFDAPFDPITYNVSYTCDDDEGQHYNYANLTDTDTDEELASDDVTVDVDCYALEVTKNAQTSATKNCTWALNKSVDVDSWNLFRGDTGISEFTLEPSVNCEDQDRAVTGNITVHNPAPIAATINGVSDLITPGDISAPVTCLGVSFPYSLAADDDLNCTYSANLPNEDTRTNNVTATLQNYVNDPPSAPTESGTTDFSGTAQVAFGSATSVIHKCVILNDEDYVAEFDAVDPGALCYFDAPFDPITYNVSYTCDGDEGNHQNTATITDNATAEELDFDTEDVNVVCNVAGSALKNATTSFNRTWAWDIQKEGNQSTLTLAGTEDFTVKYNITVPAPVSTDSAWAVTGFITINNALDREMDVTEVVDTITGGIPGVVDCGSDLTIDPGLKLVCTYSSDLPNATTRTNTANANISYATVTCYYDVTDKVCGPDGGTQTEEFPALAGVTFDGPTNVIDDCIDVTDTYAGDLGQMCVGDAPTTFTYERTIGPFGTCGHYQVNNTAAFETNVTGTTGDANWTVDITVPCEGCTLTPGYWKTHSTYGPAAHPDVTWYLLPPVPGSLGPDTPFFQLLPTDTQTWYEVFWTNPQGGNAYYILAHQYEAAVLNSLAGADVPPNVATAISQAATLLDQYDGNPNSFDGLKGKNAATVRNQFITLAGILGNYNSGIIGPGHCDEDGTSAPG